MIGNVESKQKIKATKINDIINSVNANTRNINSVLNKSTLPNNNLRPVDAAMYFHIIRNGSSLVTTSAEGASVGKLGAMMYVGGSKDAAKAMVVVNGKNVDDVYILNENNEYVSIDDIIQGDTVSNQYGAYIPLKAFLNNEQNTNNVIKAALFEKVGTIDTGKTGIVLVVFFSDTRVINEKTDIKIPIINANDGYNKYAFKSNTIRLIYSEDKYTQPVLSSSSASGVVSDIERTQFNQCHLGVLQYELESKMFLDAEKHLLSCDENGVPYYCWKVYVDNKLSDGSSAPYGFYNVFNGDIWPSYNIYGGWLILEEHPITTPLYCGFTLPENPNGSKYKKIVFGTFSDLAPSASGSSDLPYFTQGSSESGELYPDLVPILIADYDSNTDKVKQYFHGLLVDTFPIPDSRDPNWIGSVNDGYRGVGKSLDWVHIISSPWEQANLLELYNFSKESTFSDGEDCDEYEVTIKNDDGSDYETGSRNKTVLMRGDNSHELKYGKLVISKSALSSLINSDPDEDDPYRPPVHEDGEGCTDEMKASGYGYYVWSACDERWMPAYGDGSVADGLYWKQGGNHGTNYGATIGDVNGQAVIYLTNKILRGDWKVDGKYQIMNNLLYITVGADMGMNTAYFQLDNAYYGPKVITDGNGDSVTVLAKLN